MTADTLATPAPRARAVLLLAALAIAGCIEVTDQRIAWSYDAGTDVLDIVIHYGGLSSDAHRRRGILWDAADPAREVRAFLEECAVLPPYSPLALPTRPEPYEESWRDDPGMGGAAHIVAELLAHVDVAWLGAYRDVDGRLGVVQHVRIRDVHEVLALANRLVDAGVLDEFAVDDPDVAHLPRTAARWREAARGGHAWLGLEGNAFLLRIPVDPHEWRRARSDALRELALDVAEDVASSTEGDAALALAGFDTFASLPLSLVDDGDAITFRAGVPGVPGLVRMFIQPRAGHEAPPEVEQAITDVVGAPDLDARLLAHLLGEQVDPALEPLVGFGPPEERVRALLGGLADRGAAPRARTALDGFAAQWNAEGRLPTAPEAGAAVDAWRAWYRALRHDLGP